MFAELLVQDLFGVLWLGVCLILSGVGMVLAMIL